MIDGTTTVDALVRRHWHVALAMAEKNRKPGYDFDEIESAATGALLMAARKAVEAGDIRDFAAYASVRIWGAIAKVRRDAPYSHVAGLPIRLRIAAAKCRAAAEQMAARGIRRFTADDLAFETGLDRTEVRRFLAIPEIVVVQSATEWAEARPAPAAGPSLVPLFGPTPGFTPLSRCPHGAPIRRNSRLCCMMCHQSGLDHRKEFRRTPETDPAPEPRPKDERPAGPPLRGRMKPETRADRRQRIFPPAETQANAGEVR